LIKVRLRFSKTGPLRYIGHLDFLKVFQQTIRRAGLPMAYSQGFNPHMQLSFALPLPVGMVSIIDYADITLESEMPTNEIVSRFNDNAPGGLRLTSAWEFTGPGAAALVTVADYMLVEPMDSHTGLLEKADAIVQPLLSRESIVIPKKTKSGVKDTDIRPDILDISVEGYGINSDSYNVNILMRLAAGSGRFLNPIIVAKLLTGRDIDTTSIVRMDLYGTNDKKELVSLYEPPIYK